MSKSAPVTFQHGASIAAEGLTPSTSREPLIAEDTERNVLATAFERALRRSGEGSGKKWKRELEILLVIFPSWVFRDQKP